MKILPFILALITFQGIRAAEIVQKISEIPEELKENADQIYITDRLFLDVKSESEFTKEVYIKVAVMNDDSYYRSFAIGYDKFTSIKNLKLTVYDANGKKLESYKKKDFQDLPSSAGEIYTENRVLQLDLERHQTPYILEIETLEKHVEDLLYTGFIAQNYNTAVLSSSCKVRYPSSLGVQYKIDNSDKKPTVTKADGFETVEWKFNKLPALEFETMGPRGSSYFPYISIRPTDFLYDGYKGSMKSWESYNDFYYNLNKDRDILSSEMKIKVEEMIEGLQTNEEKIKVLYQYLKDNMRYVSIQLGIGGWQTFDAAYVERNKFGDCKALSNFMGGMLKHAGIDNHKVLIYRGQSGYRELEDDFVNTPFNHAIIYVPEEEMFLECTSNSYPPGYLGLDNSDHKVLVSTEDGPLFLRTPYMGKDENRTTSTTTVQILESGGAKIQSSTMKYGGSHDYLRNVKDRRTKVELDESFQENYNLSIRKLNLYEIRLDPDLPQLEIKYDVEVGKYASKAGKRLFIPVDPIHGTLSTPKKVDTRKLPFGSESEYTIEDEITVLIPEGYEIESLPENNYDETSDYGDYRMTIVQEGNKIKVYKKWVSKKFSKSADQYEDYRSKIKEFANLDRLKIVMVQKKT